MTTISAFVHKAEQAAQSAKGYEMAAKATADRAAASAAKADTAARNAEMAAEDTKAVVKLHGGMLEAYQEGGCHLKRLRSNNWKTFRSI
jgi:hypothetical protein